MHSVRGKFQQARRRSVRLGPFQPNYFSELETLTNRPLTFEPRLTIEAAMATPTPEAIIAYSIAVAPLSQRMKRKTDRAIAVFGSFNMVFRPF